MQKSPIISLAFLAAFPLVAVSPAWAEDSAAGSTDSTKTTTRHSDAEKAFKMIEGRTDRKLERCQAVEGKIKERLDNDSGHEKQHAEQYTKLVTAITNLIARGDTAGYDTAALASELTILKAKIATFNADKASYIAGLTTSKKDACAMPERDFKNAVINAHTELAVLFADVKDIQDYVKNTIRPTVVALKKAVKASASPTPSPSSATN